MSEPEPLWKQRLGTHIRLWNNGTIPRWHLGNFVYEVALVGDLLAIVSAVYDVDPETIRDIKENVRKPLSDNVEFITVSSSGGTRPADSKRGREIHERLHNFFAQNADKFK
jgi:hypothetical protein